jgi:hypothetical protein
MNKPSSTFFNEMGTVKEMILPITEVAFGFWSEKNVWKNPE